MSTRHGGFVWYELMTNDLPAAETFYETVLGWSLADAGMPGMTYRLASVGGSPIAGLMPIPQDVAASGGYPSWSGYIGVADVDAHAGRVKALGGSIHREPADIPEVGRFAVAADPQGAVFVLFKATRPSAEPLAYMTPGTVGWHELHATDWEQVFPFYAELFGWEKSTAMDMGPMGTYQLLGTQGADFGAMFNNADVPRPFWLYYVSVPDIDAAQARLTEAGGKLTSGPHQVPGDMWILQVRDPQGAAFAMVGPRPKA